jgi:hypothetical protein
LPAKEDTPFDKAVASLDKDGTAADKDGTAALVAVRLLTKGASLLDDFARTSMVDGSA